MGTTSRTFLRTHPWIKFSVNLHDCDGAFWARLGEIKSKCEQVSNVLLPPGLKQRMLSVYLARGVHATTAIEGNTLSEEDVRNVIEKTDQIPQSQQYQKREVENIIDACNWIGEEVFGNATSTVLSTDRILEFNCRVLNRLPLEDSRIVPGEIYLGPVVVAGYHGAPRDECRFLLDRLCEWINSLNPPSDSMTVEYSFIKAVLAHLYIAWIHPFGDGNGRVARLIELQILCGASVPDSAGHLLSNHYNQTRSEYYRQLKYASNSGGDVIPFMEYAFGGFLDQINEQLGAIQLHQIGIAWKEHVYSVFQEESGAATTRRRQVALDLWEKETPMSSSEIRHLSPLVAEMYAGKMQKTISRDLNFLIGKQLILKVDGEYRPNFGLLGRMLPRKRNST